MVMRRKSAVPWEVKAGRIRAMVMMVVGGEGLFAWVFFLAWPQVTTEIDLLQMCSNAAKSGDRPHARDECNLACRIHFHLLWSLTSPFQWQHVARHVRTPSWQGCSLTNGENGLTSLVGILTLSFMREVEQAFQTKLGLVLTWPAGHRDRKYSPWLRLLWQMFDLSWI